MLILQALNVFLKQIQLLNVNVLQRHLPRAVFPNQSKTSLFYILAHNQSKCKLLILNLWNYVAFI